MKRITKIMWRILKVSLFMWILISLPIFRIDNIEIIGNESLTSEYLIEELEIEKNKTNIFYYNKKKIEKKLELKPYIKKVKIEKKIPSNVRVIILEREALLYLPYKNNEYIYIDKEGIVLEVSEGKKEDVPEIIGIKYEIFNLGEKLNTENELKIKGIYELLNKMERYGLNMKKIKIDIQDRKKIKMNYNNVQIHIGELSELDYKARMLKGITDALVDRGELRGVIDISNTNIEPYLVFEKK